MIFAAAITSSKAQLQHRDCALHDMRESVKRGLDDGQMISYYAL
jgi:hypothetical protein